ncbi:MAG: hypothetical protein WAL30_05005 [Candidatus Aquirickettsiella sp.]
MSCDSKELKVNPNVTKIYEKLARQSMQTNASVSISHENILQLSRVTNSKGGEAELIIKPLVNAVNQYDNQFNKNYNQLLELIEPVGNNNESAINQFKDILNDDISINVHHIQSLAMSTKNELNVLREKNSKKISNLATQINYLEINQTELNIQTNLLVDEIHALQQQLSDLKWWWTICILPFLCAWLPILIQEVGFNKSQKKAELYRKFSELNDCNFRLTTQRTQQQNLRNEQIECNTLLVNITAANSTCIFIENNISGIADLLEDIDPDNTPRLLRRQLLVLQQNWSDLVNGMRLVAVSLSIHI